MSDPTKFVVPELDDNGLAGLAGVLAIRQIGETVHRMGEILQTQVDKLQEVHTDMQVMKASNKQFEELRDEVKELRGQLLALQLRDAQQDGAAKFLGWIKDYSPWFIAILAFLWGLLGRHPA